MRMNIELNLSDIAEIESFIKMIKKEKLVCRNIHINNRNLNATLEYSESFDEMAWIITEVMKKDIKNSKLECRDYFDIQSFDTERDLIFLYNNQAMYKHIYTIVDIKNFTTFEQVYTAFMIVLRYIRDNPEYIVHTPIANTCTSALDNTIWSIEFKNRLATRDCEFNQIKYNDISRSYYLDLKSEPSLTNSVKRVETIVNILKSQYDSYSRVYCVPKSNFHFWFEEGKICIYNFRIKSFCAEDTIENLLKSDNYGLGYEFRKYIAHLIWKNKPFIEHKQLNQQERIDTWGKLLRAF